MAGVANVAKVAGVKAEVVHNVLAAIGKIAETERVTFVGFGTFKMETTEARIGRNPQNGNPVAIPGKTVLRFKASK